MIIVICVDKDNNSLNFKFFSCTNNTENKIKTLNSEYQKKSRYHLNALRQQLGCSAEFKLHIQGETLFKHIISLPKL